MRFLSRTFLAMGIAVSLLTVLSVESNAQTCVNPPAGLLGWWDADSVSGSTAFDIADSNNGTMTAAVGIVSGKVGNAFSFGGTDQVSGTLNGFAGGDTPITIGAWFNEDGKIGHPGRGIMGVGNTNFKGHFFLRLSTGEGAWNTTYVCIDGTVGINRLCLGADDGNDRWWPSTAEITTNAWHFAAASYDPSNQQAKIYVDGAFDRSAPITGGLDLGKEFWIGRDAYWDSFFVGLVDEAQVYGRILSADEIHSIFVAGEHGLCKGPQVVLIDVKPGGDPNTINLSSAGTIPVAILSTADFNAPAQVDRDSLRLAGAAVNLIGKSGKYQCATQDVNADGLPDLVCHFETAQFMIEAGDTTATLEGKTIEGRAIRGQDSVRIVRD